MTGERILVWGAGAIGGTLAAFWARAGHDVTLVDVVAEHNAACRRDGLAIEGPVDALRQRIPAFTPEEIAAGRSGDASAKTWPLIVLAVKAQATEAAAAQLAPFLSPDGFVLSAQNGLNELAIADAVGAGRTMGAFVNFGADWLGPGRILYGNRGAVVVGEIDGTIRERTRAMHALLQVFEPDAVLTDNIWGYLWGKLAYGAMLFATALTPDSIADTFADPARTAALIALGREVMAVARARGVVAVGFNGFDPARFAPEASLAGAQASIAALEAFNRPNAKTHSGVWRDIAVRRRRTEVDAQIAIIDRLGGEAGIDTPVIRRLVALMHDVEEGRRPQSAETFGELMPQ